MTKNSSDRFTYHPYRAEWASTGVHLAVTLHECSEPQHYAQVWKPQIFFRIERLVCVREHKQGVRTIELILFKYSRAHQGHFLIYILQSDEGKLGYGRIKGDWSWGGI